MADSRTQMLPEHRRAPLLHAGFWRRVAAFIIDGLILGVGLTAAYVVMVVVPLLSAHQQPRLALMFARMFGYFALVIVVQWLYFALLESSRWQATAGKAALGLRVTDEYGRRIGFGRASGRFFGKILSGMIFDIGYMLAGWTARKQALHDLIAGCCVVRKDGLAMFEYGEPATPDVRSAGMPGWAIGLIVVVVGVFVAVPVLAIVAAIVIPAYQAHAIRNEVAAGVTLSHHARIAVTEYIARHGELPEDNADVGLAHARAIHGRYVSSVAVREGHVVVTYGNRADSAIRGSHLVLVPHGNLGAFHWQCRSPDIRVRYLPSQCRH